jgi:polysaccharide biosynthesis/export protein
MHSPIIRFSVLLIVILITGHPALLSQTSSQSPTQSNPPNNSKSPVPPEPNTVPIPQISNLPERSTTPVDDQGRKNNVSREDDSKRATSSLQQPIEEPDEFQKFVERSTGVKLPLFGYDLFRDVPTTFAPVDKVPVTANYVIGPGDEILLRGWGQVDINYRAIVDRFGNIYVPKVGNLTVAGLTYEQLQPYLKSAIGRIFRNFDLNVSMGQLRSIQVFVVGNAARPGAYTVSSLSSLVNTLFASGGPSTKGSMRSIQLKRGATLISDFDFYDLVLRGDKSKDQTLLPGDVIYVAPTGAVVAVAGSVRMPAIYEIKDGETLQDVIRYAGGLTPLASTQMALVESSNASGARSVSEYALDAEGLKHQVRNGDLISITAAPGRFENSVTLRGNVTTPGRYPWKPGMRIKDLIPDPQTLITRDYWKRKLQRDLSAALLKSADGDHREEIEQNLRNDVKRYAPDVNWDYAVVQRLDQQRLTTALVTFNLGKAILDGDPNENILLESGDVVTVFSQADVRVPVNKQTKFVRLEGEFAVSGIYEVRTGETLKQLIARAGGFTPQAYLYGSEFTRESTRIGQQKRFDEFVRQLEAEVERSASRKSQNVVSGEEALGLRSDLESQRRLVEKLRETRPTGRIVLGVTPLTKNLEDLPDLPLEDGDHFIVPFRPAVVNVIGAVYNENSFLYQDSRSAGYYLRRAGGGNREADLSRMFIIRADGSVLGRQRGAGWFSASFTNIKLMPGDTIVVPEKLDRITFLKGLKDWSLVIGQFALGAAAIKTLTRP